MKIYFAGNTMLRPREMMLLKIGKGQRLNSYWYFDLAWKKFLDLYKKGVSDEEK